MNNDNLVFWCFLYFASIGLVFDYFSDMFFVINFVLFSFLILGFLVMTLVSVENNKSIRLTVVGVHIVLALALYPPLDSKCDHYLSYEDQSVTLRKINTYKLSFKKEVGSQFDLACSLQDDMNIALLAKEPNLYWFFPPTFLMLFWSIFFFYKLKIRAA